MYIYACEQCQSLYAIAFNLCGIFFQSAVSTEQLPYAPLRAFLLVASSFLQMSSEGPAIDASCSKHGGQFVLVVLVEIPFNLFEVLPVVDHPLDYAIEHDIQKDEERKKTMR